MASLLASTASLLDSFVAVPLFFSSAGASFLPASAASTLLLSSASLLPSFTSSSLNKAAGAASASGAVGSIPASFRTLVSSSVVRKQPLSESSSNKAIIAASDIPTSGLQPRDLHISSYSSLNSSAAPSNPTHCANLTNSCALSTPSL